MRLFRFIRDDDERAACTELEFGITGVSATTEACNIECSVEARAIAEGVAGPMRAEATYLERCMVLLVVFAVVVASLLTLSVSLHSWYIHIATALH